MPEYLVGIVREVVHKKFVIVECEIANPSTFYCILSWKIRLKKIVSYFLSRKFPEKIKPFSLESKEVIFKLKNCENFSLQDSGIIVEIRN
ncbi:hypothetical protein [Mycoplasma suis]|uniref:Uncharacterized protein n=1 Tax=Mycoplasma suis (strain Illinois) TaxID=768700 RepID=F0QR56_MYCSL|nr:hypothetical protein [Mycoplasma suis]ADX97976.1 hypothetical protein MSU_0440 [Mycoplasma suis str. Illinois]